MMFWAETYNMGMCDFRTARHEDDALGLALLDHLDLIAVRILARNAWVPESTYDLTRGRAPHDAVVDEADNLVLELGRDG
jgi:hypothetical protein